MANVRTLCPDVLNSVASTSESGSYPYGGVVVFSFTRLARAASR